MRCCGDFSTPTAIGDCSHQKNWPSVGRGERRGWRRVRGSRASAISIWRGCGPPYLSSPFPRVTATPLSCARKYMRARTSGGASFPTRRQSRSSTSSASSAAWDSRDSFSSCGTRFISHAAKTFSVRDEEALRIQRSLTVSLSLQSIQ